MHNSPAVHVWVTRLYFRTALTGKLMWKKVHCAEPVSMFHQVEEERIVKAAFFNRPGRMGNISGRMRRGHMMLGEAGPCTLGVISWPSNCSQDDAVRLWKAACVRECRGSPAAQGPDMYSGLEKPARCPWTGGAHSLSFTLESPLSCGTQCPTLLTLFHPSFCFYTKSFPSIPLHQSPIASIAASVVFLAYPDLFLFFF